VPRQLLLRNTRFHFSLLVLVAVAGASAVALGAGCSADAATSDLAKPAAENPDPEGDKVGISETDAGSGPKSLLRGSPLCRVTPGKCLPDDDGEKRLPYGAGTCVVPPADAGSNAPVADASTIANGCRIAKETNLSVAPKCFVELADRRGIDGVYCEHGSNCAPGFDCVKGEKSSVCRRYCCAGTCETHTAQNGGPTFCDIQRLVDVVPHDAPVCMPLKKCKLLVPGECKETETCALVTEKGDTGCVLTGEAEAGQSCDEQHCQSDLTCLGNPGDRRCYKLCRTQGLECGSTETCTTGTVFQDTTFGVCRER
jgi:hypothetical protein